MLSHPSKYVLIHILRHSAYRLRPLLAAASLKTSVVLSLADFALSESSLLLLALLR